MAQTPRKVAARGTVNTREVNNTNNTDAGISGSDDMEASGAIIEDGAKALADLQHPAVDNNPRENTTKAMNQIDFNDPTLSMEDAVEENLKAQG